METTVGPHPRSTESKSQLRPLRLSLDDSAGRSNQPDGLAEVANQPAVGAANRGSDCGPTGIIVPMEVLATNGRVSLRAFNPVDEATLLAGRDEEWNRWLGPGHDHPQPTACIVVGDEIVGWVDSDPQNQRLRDGETNLGYNVFAPHRGNGYATDAVVLMLQWMKSEGDLHTATMSIDRRNHASLRIAEKAGFVCEAEIEDAYLFSAPIR